MRITDRAVVYTVLGRYESAIRDYDKVIELNANSSAHQLQEAVRDYEKAMALELHPALPYFNRGNLRLQLGRTAEAIQDFGSAIALKPDFPEAYNNRAAAYLGLHEYDKARADIQMCVRLGGKPDSALTQALTAASEQKPSR